MRTTFRSTFLRPGLAAALTAGLALAAAGPAAAGWSADLAHSKVNFSINHFFTPVTGSFKDFQVDLAYDPENPAKSHVKAQIEVASIDTGNQRRDDHLRSADWFEAEKYPYMTFESTSVRAEGEDQLVADGTLTIKGKPLQASLRITRLGVTELPAEMQARMGGIKQVASFKATTAIDRGDFGVGVGDWAGTLVVGSDVDIEILVEAHNK